MKTEPSGQELHDRATRGLALTPEEQTVLEKWYALQNQEESALLLRTSPPHTLRDVQEQVNAALSQLPSVLQRIQALATGNEALRREITELQRQNPR